MSSEIEVDRDLASAVAAGDIDEDQAGILQLYRDMQALKQQLAETQQTQLEAAAKLQQSVEKLATLPAKKNKLIIKIRGES